MRLSNAVLAAALLLGGATASAQIPGSAEFTFSNPVVVGDAATTQDILEQSDQFTDGVLHVGNEEFVFDDHGHPVFKQPDQRWYCRWFGIFCVEFEAGPMPVTLEAAQAIVRAAVIPKIQEEMLKDTGRVLPLLAFAWDDPMPKRSVIGQFFAENPPLNVTKDSWFFFLDLEPHADFGHRTEYVLVDGTTGDVTRLRAFSPPVIDGEPWLIDMADRFASRARFYPEDMADLPEPSAWPLKFASPKVESPRPLVEPQSALPGTINVATVDDPATLLAFLLPSASAQATATDPCANQTRRKVGIIINGEPRSRSQHFDHSAGAAAGMFKRLGVGNGDLHWFKPETTPNPEDVIKEIERIGATLGPCDKLFFYITGHGTITDENGDGVPDHPSQGIVYGEGTLNKSRYGNSFTEALEKAKAGEVNIMVQSCFAGSLLTLIDDQALSPPTGSNWHVFVSSPADKSSYGGDDEYRSSPYTENLSYCVSLKMHERGIQNPTIEQIEEMMKECQKQMADNPETYVEPLQPRDVASTVVTVSPEYVSIPEGDEGQKSVGITISRNNVNRDVRLTYHTYESDKTTATPGVDYERVTEGRKLSLELTGGTMSAQLNIAVFGDTDVEPDESFYIWIPELGKLILITIVNDDGVATSSSSRPATAMMSSTSSASSTYTVTVTIDEPVKVDLGDGAGIGTLDLGKTAGGDYVLTWTPEDAPPKITIDLQYAIEPETTCPDCEEILDEIIETAWECNEISLELDAAKAEVPDLERQLADAQKKLTDARKRLNDFDNPRSWVESDGRRVTSTDLAVTNAFNKETWNDYKNGDATAQETSDTWGRGPTAEDRERIKKELRDKLQEDVDEAQDHIEDLEDRLEDAKDDIEDLTAELEDCQETIDELYAELEECEKRCAPKEEESSASSEDDDHDGDDDEDEESSEDDHDRSSTPGTVPGSSKTSASSVPTAVMFSAQSTSRSSAMASATAEQCKTGAMERSACDDICDDGQCIQAYTRNNGVACYRCEIKEEEQKCSSGKTPDRGACEEICDEAGGVCEKDNNGCYGCTVYECPSGTTETCPSNCTGGCDSVSEGPKACYQCKQSCEDVCAGQDYTKVGMDWTSYMLEYLSGYTCVSGASAQMQYATIGNCTCSNQPSISVDQTKPVCKATSCGDVVCGNTTTCSVEGGTATVSCNWKGWKATDINKVTPMIGQ